MNPRERRQKPVVEINITPFTDVILVLLVIFMITTPLILQSSIKVNLPWAGSAKARPGGGEMRITVTERGLIYLDDAIVTKKELEEKVSMRHNSDPGVKIILFSDKFTRFKDIVMVLDIINKIGIRNLSIAARVETNGR